MVRNEFQASTVVKPAEVILSLNVTDRRARRMAGKKHTGCCLRRKTPTKNVFEHGFQLVRTDFVHPHHVADGHHLEGFVYCSRQHHWDIALPLPLVLPPKSQIDRFVFAFFQGITCLRQTSVLEVPQRKSAQSGHLFGSESLSCARTLPGTRTSTR